MPSTEVTIDNGVLCERVLGWEKLPNTFYGDWCIPSTGCFCHTPNFSHDISAAMLLVEACEEYFVLRRVHSADSPSCKYWGAILGPSTVMADTPAAAITEAVWALVQEKGDAEVS